MLRPISKRFRRFCWINVGKLGALIDYLKTEQVTEAIMAGKVPKALLFKQKLSRTCGGEAPFFDEGPTDDGILRALTGELQREGVRIVDTVSFSPDLLMPSGVITRNRPSQDEWKDIMFGWTIAKGIGSMDIGQTVVVKGKAVMAVEAIEGTDEAILRGGSYANGGANVVKVSKPHQDMRLDVPAIGLMTLDTMIRAGARVLALEAGKSIIIDRQKMITRADEAGITIVGVTPEVLEGIR